MEELLIKDEKLSELDVFLQSFLSYEQQVELAKLGNMLPDDINRFIKDLFSILDKIFVKKSNLFVSKYQLYLPNEEDLKQLINRIIEEGGNEQEE